MTHVVSLNVNGSDTPLIVLTMQGEERLSRDYTFRLTLVCSGKETINTKDYLNQTASIEINIHHHVHCIRGVITAMQQNFTSDSNQQRFELQLGSILSRSNKALCSDIYLDQTPQQTISDILSNYSQLDFHIAVGDSIPSKTFIHQYKESDYHFINRLCEHWGVYYYFDYEEDDKLIFADDNQYPIDERLFEFIEQPSAPQKNNAITSLSVNKSSTIGHITVEGRNPNNDMLLIQAKAGSFESEQLSTSINNIGIDSELEANIIAHRRLEQENCKADVYVGTTHAAGLKPGFVIKVQLTQGTPPIELLITNVKHSAVNLDYSKHEEGEEYLADFTAIPALLEYRPEHETAIPKAISSTARIFSSYDSPSLSYRDELGRYQVVFDYIKSEKISHWIRRSLTAAKDNHLDIPLLPDTEVQISYLGGHPDLPYISSALENSQSNGLISNNQNPYTAHFATSGLLNIEAGRSFSVSFRAPMNKQSNQNTPADQRTKTDTSKTATPSNYERLDNQGALFIPSEVLELNSKDYNLSSSQGQNYKIQDSVTFYLGDNPSYYFGQQYREVHAKAPAQTQVATNDSYPFNNNIILEEDTTHHDASLNIPIDRQVGMVRKLFGNRYNFHDGHIVTVRKNDQGPHKTLNYGPRYIEHINNDQTNATDSITDGFPADHQPTADDYIVRTHLKHFKINHADTVSVQVGNSYVERTGDTKRVQNNGRSSVEIDGISRDKVINVSEHSKKHITANSIEAIFRTSKLYKALYGNRRSETFGSDNSMVLGAKTSLVVGPVVAVEVGLSDKQILGAKIETILGLKFEGIAGPVIKWASNVESKVGPGNMKKEGFSLKDAEVQIQKVKADLQTAKVSITNALLTIIG